jgi:hypothetical protein
MRWVQRSLALLWPVTVLALWATWAMRTWSSQGRLVFTAISAWSTWQAVGLGSLAPRRWAHWILGVLVAGMVCLTLWAPWGAIAPAYRPPLVPEGVTVTPTYDLEADVGGQLRLMGYDIDLALAHPGEYLEFTLYWEAQQPMQRNWSVFCHLLDAETELPIVIRDRYPGQGLLSTSTMQAGMRWTDRYALQVPRMAYAPRDALLEVGIYDLQTGERPPIAIVAAGDGVSVTGNALRFQPVRILAREGRYPNPLDVSFEDELRLVGWDIDRRLTAPGETLHLVLYWECLREMDEDYTVFAQIIDDRGQKWAQWDAWPADVATSTWRAGDTFEDPYDLTLDGATPAGGKTLIMGLYRRDANGELERLRIINEEGRMVLRTYVVLDHIAVRERAP